MVAGSAVAALLMATPGAAFAVGSPTPPRHSAAPPFGLSQLTYKRMLAQIPLDAAATQIQAAAAKPGAGHDGFFETSVNDDQHTLTVYWHGARPADISQLIRRLQRNTTIRVAAAAYSRAQLHTAVLQSLRTPGAVGAVPLNDGSGIEVEVGSTQAAAAASALAPRLGVPVRTAVTGGGKTQAACYFGNITLDAGSRCYDLPPYWGGDVIVNGDDGSACSTAFGMHDSGGGQSMLTAAHCATTTTAPGLPVLANGVTFYNGNSTRTMGQITGVPGRDDGAIIPTSAGYRYYDGPGLLGGDTYNTKRVANQEATSRGDWLCESGAFGGVICGLQVVYTGATVCDPLCWNNLALTVSTTGQLPITGDSGGPWFALAGFNTVSARGVHHGVFWDNLSKILLPDFTPITVLSSDLHISVNTVSAPG